jgi:tetratricopeptide (TPR) repeat protein
MKAKTAALWASSPRPLRPWRAVDAEGLYERALAFKEKALGTDHVALAYSLVGLAQVYGEQGKNADAERLYKRARAIREKALGTDHPGV